jgi:hypothetical protein
MGFSATPAFAVTVVSKYSERAVQCRQIWREGTMENGPKVAIGVSLVMVAALGIRVGLIYKANHEPGTTRGGDAGR